MITSFCTKGSEEDRKVTFNKEICNRVKNYNRKITENNFMKQVTVKT